MGNHLIKDIFTIAENLTHKKIEEINFGNPLLVRKN